MALDVNCTEENWNKPIWTGKNEIDCIDNDRITSSKFQGKNFEKNIHQSNVFIWTRLPGISAEVKTKSTEAINGDLLGLKVQYLFRDDEEKIWSD